MVVVANGVKPFVVALHVQKYSDKNFIHTASNPYNHSTTKSPDICQFYKNVDFVSHLISSSYEN